MASTDARPIPIKNTAFRAVFPILDADGDLVTGATGLDSEVSKDQGTFADCTNEATEIATASGMYYLDLTATEMNADCVAVIVKTSSSGAKTTVLVFYPEETGDINVDVTAFGGTAATASGGRPEVNTSHIAGAAVSAASAQIGVNVVQISGDSAAADNAESFFDGTGYAGTGNVIPTVTTLTNAPSDSAGVTTLLSRLSALRAGYLDNLSAGAVATAAKLLSYFQTALRKDVTADADIGGTYDDATDSLEAVRDNMGTAQTGDAFARLGAPAGASVSADIAASKVVADAIKAKTDNLPTDPADASDVAAGLAALNDLSAAEVNAEVVDALATDTYAEITGVPGFTVSLSTMIRRLYAALINPVDVTASKKTFKSAAGVAQWEKDLSDDGTTYGESSGNAP